MRECECLELKLVRSGKTSEPSDQAAPSFPGGGPLVQEHHTSHPGQGIPPGWKTGPESHKAQAIQPPEAQESLRENTISTRTQQQCIMDYENKSCSSLR